MSENLDLVRSIYADWERGDFTRTEWAHRDVELVWADGPAPTTWSGLRGAEAGWREFLGTWQDYRVHPVNYFAPDDERVLVLVRFTARGKVSGLEVGESRPKGANIFHIRDRLVRRLVLYWDRDRALADLGLEDEVVSRENAEIVRRALRARRSEFEDLLDPAVRLDLSERVFNPAVYEGYEGIMQWRADVGETWESYRSEAEEFFEGPEGVVVFTQEHGRGKGSGIEVRQRPTALICRLRGGRVSEIRLYHDRQRALRDAGIKE